jgi:hypothetical protein
MNPRFIRRLLPLLAVAGVAAGTLAPSALADSYGPTSVINVNSGKQLDLRGASTSPGAIAIQYHGTGWGGLVVGDNQRWNVPYHDSTSGSPITNYHSGLCLTTDGVAGHAIDQEYCNGGSHQTWVAHSQWVWSELGYETYFQNPASGLVIDVNQASKSDSAPVVAWYYNGGLNQLWEY